jgi:hypothetical protein
MIVAATDAAIVAARRPLTTLPGRALRRYAALRGAALDLKHASGVRADDDARSGPFDRIELAREQRVGHRRLLQVVGTGAPAAHVRLRHLDELESGHAAQQRARCGGDALRVGKVAGFLVRRAHRERAEWGRRGQRGEIFGDVSHLGAERLCPCSPRGIVVQQMSVRLEVRTAARSVDHDRVESRGFECCDVVLRERDRVGALAGVRVQRATADLGRRVDDSDAQAREHPRGSGMHVAVRNAHDAAEQQCDARDGSGRRRRRLIVRSRQRRVEAFEPAQAPRQPLAQAARAQRAPQPAPFVQCEQAGEAFQASGIGERVEGEPAQP